MDKLFAALDGKKTYFIAGLTFIAGGLRALGYEVPEWVWAMLTASGAGAMRFAIAKIEKQ